MTGPIRNRGAAVARELPYNGRKNVDTGEEELRNELVLEPVSSNELVETSQTMEDVDAEEQLEPSTDFPMLSAEEELKRSSNDVRKSGSGNKIVEVRRITVPPHRYSPLKKHWPELVEPIVQHMKLQIRMNVKRRCVELRMSTSTPGVSHLQKAADFVRSFMLGFDIQDGIALLRLDDLFLESFEVKDVKRLVGDHLSRAIGRICGKDGKTKYAIENSTRTRIVLADSYVHILGAFHNIKLARDSICALIIGSPPSKVYNRLRTVSRRLQERLQ